MENGHQTGQAALQARLNDPHTVEVLTRLLDRIDTLEQTVDRMATLMQQGPGMLSMATDIADEQILDARSRGIDIDERLRTALELAEKLTAPEMVARIDSLIALADQAPGMAAMVADIADETVRQAAANGIDIEARLRAGLEIAEKLTAPEMVANLNQFMALAESAPGMVAMLGDIADDTIRQLAAYGIDVNERITVSLVAAERLTSPEASTALMTLLDPDLVGIVGDAGGAFKDSLSMPSQKIGLFGLMRSLSDPDIQRSLNIALNFGRAFGRKLDQ
ncbi:MAG: DUF1641 domain-containing protein [Anaerolineae bacterium]|nr:DUF1641 domain-containing protein [Anaerolineae bacterium]